jgi:hypothetical protein
MTNMSEKTRKTPLYLNPKSRRIMNTANRRRVRAFIWASVLIPVIGITLIEQNKSGRFSSQNLFLHCNIFLIDPNILNILKDENEILDVVIDISKMAKKKAPKYAFTICNINLTQVDECYGFGAGRDIGDTVLPTNATRLSELDIEKGTPEVISFLDEAKRLFTCNVSMIDHTAKMDVGMLQYECFWCRYPFETRGIGCPIRYVPDQAIKSYYSEISKDIYTIKENITADRKTRINDPRLRVKEANYYETDGVFCSFNCCQAWITDNHSDKTYSNSQPLLQKMYGDMTGDRTAVILAAPHWRLRKESGGHLNIHSFREGFNKVEYRDQGTFFRFRPIGHAFEPCLRF